MSCYYTFRYADKTETKIKWAVKLFKDWQASRNIRALHSGSQLSPIIVQLEEMSVDEINYSVCRFITEVRKLDGSDYPGDTLHTLVIMLQLYLCVKGNAYKLLVDDRFAEIRNALDNMMKLY